MRLACPNCDARYEVPDGAIPDGGRDVQCSNCGNAWFQMPPEAEAEAAIEAALFGAPPAIAAPAFAQPAPLTAAGLPGGMDDPDDPAEDPALAEDWALAENGALAEDPLAQAADLPLPAVAAPPRSVLDDSVLSVLREEAEREAEARRAEAQRAALRRTDAESQMQVQPDLGMGEPAVEPSPAQRRLAMLKGEPEVPVADEPARLPARRDLLPDVEEINSTLQPDSAGRDLDAEVDALPDLTRGSAFRSGFLLVVFLLAIGAGVYVGADAIAARLPALAQPLEQYVGFVDGMRLWLNGVMDQAASAITGT